MSKLFAVIFSLFLAQAEPASLEISTDPPGAMVVLDRNVLGLSPLRIYPLRPGKHLLRISAGEDYKPYIQEIEAVAGDYRSLDIRLEPSTRLQLERGREAALEGDFRRALPFLEEAVGKAPKMPEAYWWIGQIRLVWGELEPALEAFRAYADFAPKRPDLYLFLGLIHDLAGRPAEAVTAYKLALLNTRGFEGALDDLPSNPTWKDVEALKDPRDARSRLRRAQLLSLKGRMPQALEDLKLAVRELYGDWRSQVPFTRASGPTPPEEAGPPPE